MDLRVYLCFRSCFFLFLSLRLIDEEILSFTLLIQRYYFTLFSMSYFYFIFVISLIQFSGETGSVSVIQNNVISFVWFTCVVVNDWFLKLVVWCCMHNTTSSQFSAASHWANKGIMDVTFSVYLSVSEYTVLWCVIVIWLQNWMKACLQNGSMVNVIPPYNQKTNLVANYKR